ncbi:MAG: chloride channel protein [Flavobacteriaceae bacterium]|nr:chloride channel protein [Flavobacteriaceae bacterium]
MELQRNLLLKKFLIWRIKHIPNKQFVYLVSIVVGILSGLLAALMKNTTYFFQEQITSVNFEYQSIFYFIFPIIGIILTLLIIRFGIKRPVNQGIPSVLYALSKRKGLMPAYQMFAPVFTAPITIGFGGSAGLEGPTVSGGASVASNLSRLLHLNQATRNLLIGCAAAGAMSSIFKAPIAAIIFAIEVFSLDLTLVSLLPLLFASISALLTTYFFFGSTQLLPFELKDEFNLNHFGYYMVFGVITGLGSVYFTKVYLWIERFFETKLKGYQKILLGGICLSILIVLIPPLYGEGFETINNLLREDYTSAIGTSFLVDDFDQTWTVIFLLLGLVVFKVIATSLTFGAGGKGGVFAPALFMGSALGQAFAKIINAISSNSISVSNFTLVGMAGMIAGILHAPLTAIFLIAELTGGYSLFLPLMITASLAFAISKFFEPNTVYTSGLVKKDALLTHDKDDTILTIMQLDKLIEKNFCVLAPSMTLGMMLKEGVAKSKRNLFPVLNEEKDLLGIVLLDNVREFMFDSTLYDNVYVQTLMQIPPNVINYEKDNMKVIMRKFQDSSAWNLPVLKEGKFIGFVSKSKLLSVYRRELIRVSDPL